MANIDSQHKTDIFHHISSLEGGNGKGKSDHQKQQLQQVDMIFNGADNKQIRYVFNSYLLEHLTSYSSVLR